MTEPARQELLARFFAGDRRSAARIMTLVENGGPAADELLDAIHGKRCGAHRIGITGPPGVGKSTLVEKLVLHYRAADLAVGVVAVDPSSPFSGGALLGDRIRMGAVALDPGVFIRSMATRGSLGGLAQTTRELVDVLDAFGKPVVLIETVGVGQSELDVATTAETTVVVLAPDAGDAVQAMKAGLMEVADILIVNKADRPGAAETVQALEAALALRDEDAWRPPIVPVIALTGQGLPELAAQLERHRAFLAEHGELAARRTARARRDLEEALRHRLWEAARERLAGDLATAAQQVAAGAASPYAAAPRLLDHLIPRK